MSSEVTIIPSKTCIQDRIATYEILQKGCLCNTQQFVSLSRDLWPEIYHLCCEVKSTEYSEINEDCLLLDTTIMVLIGETYIQGIKIHGSVCCKLCEIAQSLYDDTTWNMLVKSFLSAKDRFVIWGLMKGLTSFMYSFPIVLFKKRIHYILEILKNDVFIDCNAPVFQLLSYIISYNERQKHFPIFKRDVSNLICKKDFSAIESTTGLIDCFCVELSYYWIHFIEEFKSISRPVNDKHCISDFLDLWKTVSDVVAKQRNEELSTIFLNVQYVLDFFSCAFNVPLLSLKTYLDIIILVFTSSMIHQPWKDTDTSILQKTVVDALSTGFLDLLPTIVETSGFCDLTSISERRTTLEEHRDAFSIQHSITLKKVIFIIFSASAEMKDGLCISDTFLKVESFLQENVLISSDTPGHIWILDMFFPQDDLLFGAMLASLRIHAHLRKLNNLKFGKSDDWPTGKLISSLNPHKLFTNFLQKLGGDHHTLLEFLMSCETCFLLYLTTYVKSLIQDLENLMKAHSDLCVPAPNNSISFKNDNHASNVMTKSVLGIISLPHSEISATCCNDLPQIFEQDCAGNTSVKSVFSSQIVSYDYSSDSDSDQGLDSVLTNTENFLTISGLYSKESITSIINVLIKLRNALKKLVELKEFPYNVQCLIDLLSMCEAKYVLSFTNF